MSDLAEQKTFEAQIDRLPIGVRVRGNEALAAALGPTRKRSMAQEGTVIGYDRTRLRVSVKWLEQGNVEFLAPQYLTPAEG